MSPEAWLKGPIDGVPPLLMPVAHALVQAQTELAGVSDLTTEELWTSVDGAATVGFHLRHIPGAIERLMTYVDGRGLSEEQLAAIKAEGVAGEPPADAATLLAGIDSAIAETLERVRNTGERTLLEHRTVGRAGLPSNVHGLLFHIAEHTQRHVGQVVTTAKILRGRRGQPG